MKIIVFTDLHYFAGDIETAIFNTKRKLVKYALPMLDRLTELINNSYKPALVVNLGDSIQDTTEHDGDIEALKFIFDRLKRINCPCYSVLGNHDLKMMDSVKEVEAIIGRKSSFSIDEGGYHLVFLTTEVRPELGTERGGCYKAQYLADETLAWLSEDLKQNTLPALIFTHYALAEDPEVTDACMFMKNRADVKKILTEDSNVKAVFFGHQHKDKELCEDGIKYYGLGSMISDIEETDNPNGVYFEIDLDKDGISVKRKRISKDELSMEGKR